ncbi:hypothetical protein R75461_07130 [Paraburkholderia nemoris]|nr:hypothetical protein R75461_07130 [Paraburkholderia nemoris]
MPAAPSASCCGAIRTSLAGSNARSPSAVGSTRSSPKFTGTCGAYMEAFLRNAGRRASRRTNIRSTRNILASDRSPVTLARCRTVISTRRLEQQAPSRSAIAGTTILKPFANPQPVHLRRSNSTVTRSTCAWPAHRRSVRFRNIARAVQDLDPAGARCGNPCSDWLFARAGPTRKRKTMDISRSLENIGIASLRGVHQIIRKSGQKDGRRCPSSVPSFECSNFGQRRPTRSSASARAGRYHNAGRPVLCAG